MLGLCLTLPDVAGKPLANTRGSGKAGQRLAILRLFDRMRLRAPCVGDRTTCRAMIRSAVEDCPRGDSIRIAVAEDAQLGIG